MRKRTETEKKAMGLVDPIFRDLAIKKGSRGYMPLLDIICYAYANPDCSFEAILTLIQKENYYVGIKDDPQVETAETLKSRDFRFKPSMVRTIETAIEGTNLDVLEKYGLKELLVILKENKSDGVSVEDELLQKIGEKYARYQEHEDRVIIFFCKKILNYIKRFASN